MGFTYRTTPTDRVQPTTLPPPPVTRAPSRLPTGCAVLLILASVACGEPVDPAAFSVPQPGPYDYRITLPVGRWEGTLVVVESTSDTLEVLWDVFGYSDAPERAPWRSASGIHLQEGYRARAHLDRGLARLPGAVVTHSLWQRPRQKGMRCEAVMTVQPAPGSQLFESHRGTCVVIWTGG